MAETTPSELGSTLKEQDNHFFRTGNYLKAAALLHTGSQGRLLKLHSLQGSYAFGVGFTCSPFTSLQMICFCLCSPRLLIRACHGRA